MVLFMGRSLRNFSPDFLGLGHHQKVKPVIVGRGQQNLDKKSERGGFDNQGVRLRVGRTGGR